jgi:hypothetical protein
MIMIILLSEAIKIRIPWCQLRNSGKLQVWPQTWWSDPPWRIAELRRSLFNRHGTANTTVDR